MNWHGIGKVLTIIGLVLFHPHPVANLGVDEFWKPFAWEPKRISLLTKIFNKNP